MNFGDDFKRGPRGREPSRKDRVNGGTPSAASIINKARADAGPPQPVASEVPGLDFTTASQRAGQDVLLTGLPRSGTSLACRLLNAVPNVAALVEPMEFRDLPADISDADLVTRIKNFCDANRASAIARGEVVSQSRSGVIPDNTFLRTGDTGPPTSAVTRGTVRLDREFDAGMTLVLKHPGPFTALAPRLCPAFVMFAVIRHPLAVLSSWATFPTKAGIGAGRLPVPERFDSGLRNQLERTEDVLDRQIILMNWFFSRYSEFPAERVLRYEEMVATGGRNLAAIVPAAAQLETPLTSRNSAISYPTVDVAGIAERLERHGGACRAFYPDLQPDWYAAE